MRKRRKVRPAVSGFSDTREYFEESYLLLNFFNDGALIVASGGLFYLLIKLNKEFFF